MAGMSVERLNQIDDWPPIFSVRIGSGVAPSNIRSVSRRDLTDAHVHIKLARGGLQAEEIEELVAPHVRSITIETLDVGEIS